MTSETWTTSSLPIAPHLPDEKAASSPALIRIVLVGGDDEFRRALCEDLPEEETDIVQFATALSAFRYLVAGNSCDVLVADLKTYDRSGLELLFQMQRTVNPLPVVVLAEPGSFIRETVTGGFKSNGADFIDKSRGLKMITRKIELAARRARGGVEPAYRADVEPAPRKGDLVVGPLELRLDTHAAFWKGRLVPLTVTEFKTVWLLGTHAGDNVSYREIYDHFRGKDFIAGRGPEGYRTNVRSVIRHIRRKFHALDAEFSEIENFSRYGYRWRAASALGMN